jgi:L-glyceraldehyde 3-phosphate reductase
MSEYRAAENRYDGMSYRRSGRSGIMLPLVSVGLWHNFGGVDLYENGRSILLRSFDLGITHFDIANNYGPPPGSAEENFGKIMKNDLFAYRDELIISTKAGYYMWKGPYGEWGSRKYLISSLDQSLKRTGLEYVDIFYSHRPDPDTPLEETMGALDHAVRSGKALYAGISNYSAKQTKEASRILKSMGTPCLIHQPVYNMFNRWIEEGLTEVLETEGIGTIPFSPLAQGLLTNKYLNGIPKDSRAASENSPFLSEGDVERTLDKVRKLNEVAQNRNQTLAQLAVAWILRLPVITSVLIGASRVSQVEDCVGGLANLNFQQDELDAIEAILAS